MLFAATLLLTISCDEETTTTHKEKGNEQGFETKDLTAFVEGDEASRTTAEYFDNGGTDRGLHFYWTEGDRLWVNTGTASSPTLTKDQRNNISSMLAPHPTMPTTAIKRATTAKFYFNGTFSAPSYPVRYTGKGNPDGDKVTIKSVQSQTVANDASHIAEDGDCGTATATQPLGSGKYNFVLKHKASYATFLPYNSPGAITIGHITKIEVTADQALAGTYHFDDNGINTTSALASSNNIKLTLNNFPIPKAADAKTNAATMVIAPGTYTNFKVEYTLREGTNTATITKTYPSVTFTPGHNKKVSQDLQISVFNESLYYLWDAQRHYWYNYENEQPFINQGDPGATQGMHNPNVVLDARWFSMSYPGYGIRNDAQTTLFRTLPNVNELWWYIKKGNPHWESPTTRLMIRKGHFQNVTMGGLWLRKKSVIVAHLKAHEGYPAVLTWDDMKEGYWDSPAAPHEDYRTKDAYTNIGVVSGTPTNTADYFFLPTLGCYFGGWLAGFGIFGSYWSSSAYPLNSGSAYYLYFKNGQVVINNTSRDSGYQTKPFE